MKKIFLYTFIFVGMITLTACGKGEHMPLRSVEGAQNNPQKPGNNVDSPSKVTFADVKPIFKKACASCHVPGGALPDWQNYSEAFNKKDRLYDRVMVKKDMPLGGGITEDERKLIGQWLIDGALGEPDVVAPPTPNPEPTPAPPVEPINQPVITFNKVILPVFQKYCKNCHNAHTSLANWLDYNVSFAKKDRIMDRVVIKKDMPMGGQMPNENRELIKKWIEGGALKELL